MKQSKYSTAQKREFVSYLVLKEKTVKEICEIAKVTRRTLYNWRNEFPQIKKRKQVIKDSYPEHYRILQIAVNKFVDSDIKKKMVRYIMRTERRNPDEACTIVGIHDDDIGYLPRKNELPDKLIIETVKDFIKEKPELALNKHFQSICYKLPTCPKGQIRRILKDQRLQFKRYRESLKSSLAYQYLPNIEWIIISITITKQKGINSANCILCVFKKTEKQQKTVDLINTFVYKEFSDELDRVSFLKSFVLIAEQNGFPDKIHIRLDLYKKYPTIVDFKLHSHRIPIQLIGKSNSDELLQQYNKLYGIAKERSKPKSHEYFKSGAPKIDEIAKRIIDYQDHRYVDDNSLEDF